ncbi:centromere protein C-like isoform X1 [Tachypleus tridentatus]|uniref:centromere protein C-like isoform X1 n=1 Tax=Tachypleus tridentatus TaxID=6853 RepID=UPI003FD26DC5
MKLANHEVKHKDISYRRSHTFVNKMKQIALKEKTVSVCAPRNLNKAVVVQNTKTLAWEGPSGSPVEGKDPLKLCKSIELPNYCMGILVIAPLKEKHFQYVLTCSLFFVVVYGKVELHVHKSSWIIETDDSFIVPLGNAYSLKNLSHEKTKLIFFGIKRNPPIGEMVV